jgi:hypothetical protein
MRISRRLILASVHAWTSFAGTLEVIDFEDQCAIWSYDNHGCTGHSGFFSQLKGEDCSRKQIFGVGIKKNVLT